MRKPILFKAVFHDGTFWVAEKEPFANNNFKTISHAEYAFAALNGFQKYDTLYTINKNNPYKYSFTLKDCIWLAEHNPEHAIKND